MHNQSRQMAYRKKEDADVGQSEGSGCESHAPDENRCGNNINIAEEPKIFKIGHISDSPCGSLAQMHPHSVNVSGTCADGSSDGRNCTVVDCIPARSVTHLTSIIDFTGSAACSSNYVRGGQILGKATAVALQVPALPFHGPPLTASAGASAVQVATTSRSFFPSLGTAGSRLPDGEFGHCAVASSSVDCRMPAEPRIERSSERNDSAPNSGPENGRRHVSIAQRLTDVIQGRGDGDLLLQRTERENGLLQWLQALNLQVMGACRADERLRPMLQLNVSCNGADDRLLAHLSQHFKARELGMLARCLCVPLVSIRVGKVVRQDGLLCPTSTRGHLSLTLLPSSDLRLSFVGDNGGVERLAILSAGNESFNVVIEELSADTSGRSFLVKLPGGKQVYFWQSEKSKLVGDELLSKMKDLLGRRPSLAQLTGIRESRLDSFINYVRTSLLGSTRSSTQQYPMTSSPSVGAINSTEVVAGPHPSSNVSAPPLRPSQRFRLAVSQAMTHGRLHSSNQSSLSPRAGAFKDGLIRNVSCVRTVSSAREKIRRRVDVHNSISVIASPNISAIQASSDSQNCNGNGSDSWSTQISLSVTSQNAIEMASHSAGLYTSINSGYVRHGLGWEDITPLPQRYFHLPGSLPVSLPLNTGNGLPSQQSVPMEESSFNPVSFDLPVPSRVPIANSSIFAPYYCRCPLRTSSLQYTITPPFLPSMATEAVSLPPSTSFFSVGSSSSFIPPLSLDLRDVSFSPIPLPVPSLVSIPTSIQTPNLPAFLTDPVMRIPLPVSSFVTVPTPQQISGFTPFFSDPIVHIPVFDFHSSGQGYLVGAGSSISSAISPILPSLLSTLIPESDPLVEKENTHTFQFSSAGFSSPWGDSEVASCKTSLKSGLPVSTFRDTAPSLRPLSEPQNVTEGLCAGLEAQRNLGVMESPYSLCRGVRSISPGIQNLVHYSIPSQQSGPLVGMVPAVLTTTSLSCLYDICHDGKTKLTTLVTGSRGLYGGSCDLGVSSNRLAGINLTTIHDDTSLDCTVENSKHGTESNESFSQAVNEASFDKDSSITKEMCKEKSDTE